MPTRTGPVPSVSPTAGPAAPGGSAGVGGDAASFPGASSELELHPASANPATPAKPPQRSARRLRRARRSRDSESMSNSPLPPDSGDPKCVRPICVRPGGIYRARGRATNPGGGLSTGIVAFSPALDYVIQARRAERQT